jgi:hypothetical protein
MICIAKVTPGIFPGPTLGALLASALYIFLKSVHYWRLNPGQDDDDPAGSPVVPLAANTNSNPKYLPNGEKRNGLNGTVGRGSTDSTLRNSRERETV